MKNQTQRIATFNCQGLVTSAVKKRLIADDFEKYKLNSLAVQETHLKGKGTMILTSSSNKRYILYYSGNDDKSENGVGIILPLNIKATFQPINDRICKITTKVNNNQMLHIVSAYAPTLKNSQKNPIVADFFYTELNAMIKSHKSRHVTIIAGDFNAKTGSAKNNKIYHGIIGRYGKGDVNENGYHLLNFSKLNDMRITNTFFKHKPSHVTTWETPALPSSLSGRINRYRNQIDYIIVKKHNGIKI